MRKEIEQELEWQKNENEEQMDTVQYALAKGLITQNEHDAKLEAIQSAYRSIITEILAEAKEAH